MDSRCAVCGAPASFVCSRCQSTPYCGAEHQWEAWPLHKLVCVKKVVLAEPFLAEFPEANKAVLARRSARPTAAEATALGEELWVALRAKNTPECLRLIGAGADLTIKQKTMGGYVKDKTLLYYIILFDVFNQQVALALIAAMDSIREPIPGSPGFTYLAEAAANMPSVVSALLQKGADVNAEDSLGLTALLAASTRFNGPASVVATLLDHGADINHLDSEGDSALYFAIQAYNTDVALFLIERGIDVNAGRVKPLSLPYVDEDEMAAVKAALLARGAVAVGGFSRRRSRSNRKKLRKTRRHS